MTGAASGGREQRRWAPARTPPAGRPRTSRPPSETGRGHSAPRSPVAQASSCAHGGGSIQLARVFGIRVGVSPSWFFVLFLMIYSLSRYFDDVVAGSRNTSYA